MINLTENAAKHVKSLMQQHNLEGFALRVGVTAGGCSGYSYVIDITDDGEEDDLRFVCHDVEIVVDTKSHTLLDGLEVDYASSMMGGEFKFSNPLAEKACGCGTSFKVAT